MASKQPIWGIDVGQRLLKAMKLQQNGDQVELLAFDLVDLETVLGQEAGEADATAAATKALEAFASRNNLKDSRIVVAVPGQQTLTRFTKMPPVEPKKIPDMVQYEASQQIPFDIDEVVWDYQVFMEKESPDIEVGIFAIRKELIRNYLMRFTDRGIEPFIVQTSPMASYNAAKYEIGGEEGAKTACVLLDMGALATDLIVMEGNRIWSRPIPIGGNRFTDALVTAFKLSFRKAEKLKRSAATSKYARQIFQAMRPVFADLVSEVQRSIGYYTSTHREAHITRVLGMGNAFKLPGLQKFLQQNLQIEVERFSGFKRMTSAGADKAPEFVDNILSFPVAYGLALQGLGLAGVNSNLLPLEVHRGLLWQKKRVWFAASAACLLLAGATVPIGNLMANNQINGVMGGLTTLDVQRVPTTQQAEQIIAGGGGELPLEKAAKIAGAAEFLQSALTSVDRKKIGDQASLKTMAKLPENNVFIPRLVDLIQRAFAQAIDPEIRDVKTGADYVELAKNSPRAEREEAYIEKFEVLYHPQDPALFFATQGAKAARGRPGWGIKVIGITPIAEPAKFIDERLINPLLKIGRAPGRGFYIDTVTLSKVSKRTVAGPDSGRSLVEDTPSTPGGRGRPGGGGGRGRPGGGGGGGGAPPRGRPGAPEGPHLDMGGGGGIARPGENTGARTVGEEVAKWKEKLKELDPLTGEKITTDQRFVLDIVVRKGEPPANLIPDEYKPKKPEPPKKAPAKP